MSGARQVILDRILTERHRQFDLPMAEWDGRNTPNDWIAIASHYLGEEVRRGARRPTREDFEAALVKAAAVIVAALENAEAMQRDGRLG